MSTIHKLISGSTAVWDESAFAAGRYAEDASSVPSMSVHVRMTDD
jgi:hypothetical protein